jgi:type IV pilus assembly protein PilE
MSFCAQSRVKSSSGFTLLEVLITVAIVGILAAIALPSYSEYITRSKIIEATSKLGDLRTDMERFFMDNRTYQSGGNCGLDTGAGSRVFNYNQDGNRSFNITCAAPTATTYTLTATGLAAKGMTGFSYTINQLNGKTTAGLPTGWTLPVPNNCFAIRKDGSC